MSAITISLIVFLCLSATAVLGLRLQSWLPDHHLSADTKDAVKLGMGLVATMSALLLGLLVASTKGAYDTQKSEVVELAAKVVFLDQVLANYGPETAPTRDVLRRSLASAILRVWPEADVVQGAVAPATTWSQQLPQAIQRLAPRDEAQRVFKVQAAQLAMDLGQMRWLMFQQQESSVSMPMLVIMIFWLALTFLSVSLFAPPNATVVVAQLLAAFSVAGAIFLILELDRPFDGLIRIPSELMLGALRQLSH